MTSFNLNHLFKDPLSKEAHTLGYWRLGPQPTNLEGHNLAHKSQAVHSTSLSRGCSWHTDGGRLPVRVVSSRENAGEAHTSVHGTESALLGERDCRTSWKLPGDQAPGWASPTRHTASCKGLRQQRADLLTALLGGPREAWLIGSLFGGGARFVGPKWVRACQ